MDGGSLQEVAADRVTPLTKMAEFSCTSQVRTAAGLTPGWRREGILVSPEEINPSLSQPPSGPALPNGQTL